jgi:aminopeptidase S
VVTGLVRGDVAALPAATSARTTLTAVPRASLRRRSRCPPGARIDLGFNAYLAHLNNSSTADYLRVRVVHSGGTTTVYEKVGAASNVAAAWQTASVDLTPYAGQTVRLLVEAADGGTASLIEAAVDDIRIIHA